MKRRIMSYQDPTLKPQQEVVLVENSSDPLGHQLVNSYAVNKHSSLDLVELAQEIQKADSFVQATTCNKLKVIAEQMHFLKQQAEKVLTEAKLDAHLHHAACNLKKVPGKIYHLYRRPSGQEYISLLSPEEWGAAQPHEHIGSYYLQNDLSWTPVNRMGSTNVQSNLLLLKQVLNLENSREDSALPDSPMMIDF